MVLVVFQIEVKVNYDAFGVGHSSTSISAALGMAIASQLKGLKTNNILLLLEMLPLQVEWHLKD